MELTNKNTIKSLLNNYSSPAEKRFGQNFLIDNTVLNEMIDSSGINESSTVIEIGAGIGTLTREIALRSKEVFSFEIDENKFSILKVTLCNIGNVRVLNKDFLRVDFDDFLIKYDIKNYIVISSLPYNISKKIIQIILESKNKPTTMVLLIQKEVANKYFPTNKNTFLSNYLNLTGEGKIIKIVKPESFFPEPKVDSAIIKIVAKKNQTLDKYFIRFIKNGFRNPRKKLINVLASIYKENNWKLIFDKLTINSNSRAEDLTTTDWLNLYRLHNNKQTK